MLTFAGVMTYEELWHRLTNYDAGEAKAVARMVLEVRFGLSMADILCGKVTQLSADDQRELEKIALRLQQNEPVQYVLGQADFGPRTFSVAPGVLIPRPETYELCAWVVEQLQAEHRPRLLDIGTGSGCIACTLAAELPEAEVEAWDIADEALHTAAENARCTHVDVAFRQVDILSASPSDARYSAIVSNPPYITPAERSQMEARVLDHEPSLALFVPQADPMLFYRAIAQFGQQALTAGGQLFFEINPLFVDELQQLLQQQSYRDIAVRNDQFGKQRFIKATL